MASVYRARGNYQRAALLRSSPVDNLNSSSSVKWRQMSVSYAVHTCVTFATFAETSRSSHCGSPEPLEDTHDSIQTVCNLGADDVAGRRHGDGADRRPRASHRRHEPQAAGT